MVQPYLIFAEKLVLKSSKIKREKITWLRVGLNYGEKLQVLTRLIVLYRRIRCWHPAKLTFEAFEDSWYHLWNWIAHNEIHDGSFVQESQYRWIRGIVMDSLFTSWNPLFHYRRVCLSLKLKIWALNTEKNWMCYARTHVNHDQILKALSFKIKEKSWRYSIKKTNQ